MCVGVGVWLVWGRWVCVCVCVYVIIYLCLSIYQFICYIWLSPSHFWSGLLICHQQITWQNVKWLSFLKKKLHIINSVASVINAALAGLLQFGNTSYALVYLGEYGGVRCFIYHLSRIWIWLDLQLFLFGC